MIIIVSTPRGVVWLFPLDAALINTAAAAGDCCPDSTACSFRGRICL